MQKIQAQNHGQQVVAPGPPEGAMPKNVNWDGVDVKYVPVHNFMIENARAALEESARLTSAYIQQFAEMKKLSNLAIRAVPVGAEDWKIDGKDFEGGLEATVALLFAPLDGLDSNAPNRHAEAERYTLEAAEEEYPRVSVSARVAGIEEGPHGRR